MLPAMRVAALVVGAGRGERLARGEPKAFVPLAGRPLIAHALETLASRRRDRARGSRRAGRPLRRAGAAARCAGAAPEARAPPVAGGATRQDSVRAGLASLPRRLRAGRGARRGPPARCGPRTRARVVAAAARCGAAILAVPVGDTIKRARGGAVVETPPRDELFAAQTPQVFRSDWLREALAKAAAEGRIGTDCAELVEALGVRVELVEGDPRQSARSRTPATSSWRERALEARA